TDGFGLGPFSATKLEADLMLTNELLRAHLRSHDACCWKFAARRLDGELLYSNAVVEAQVLAEDFQWWKLRAPQATANAVFSNQTLNIRQFRAAFCDGSLRGRAEIQCAADNPAFQLSLEASECDLRQLLRQIGNPNPTASGKLKGQLALLAPTMQVDSFQGRGSLEITDGVLVEVPVFGIFSQILNMIVPGLGSASVTSANCTYTIGNGRARTDDLEFEMAVATVRSYGSIGLSKGDLDFRMEVQLLRSWPGLNIVTWMLGKLFEYKVGGTINNPNWRPTRLPKEIMPHRESRPTHTTETP
ncbi:MAG: AsmA-like C-terminal region-containing protein, partial [Verrucomicrobiae bacterium]|nr:AsmA-like C-terminal region-containing protein [Verrucomicrobiae bacterium]